MPTQAQEGDIVRDPQGKRYRITNGTPEPIEDAPAQAPRSMSEAFAAGAIPPWLREKGVAPAVAGALSLPVLMGGGLPAAIATPLRMAGSPGGLAAIQGGSALLSGKGVPAALTAAATGYGEGVALHGLGRVPGVMRRLAALLSRGGAPAIESAAAGAPAAGAAEATMATAKAARPAVAPALQYAPPGQWLETYRAADPARREVMLTGTYGAAAPRYKAIAEQAIAQDAAAAEAALRPPATYQAASRPAAPTMSELAAPAGAPQLPRSSRLFPQGETDAAARAALSDAPTAAPAVAEAAPAAAPAVAEAAASAEASGPEIARQWLKKYRAAPKAEQATMLESVGGKARLKEIQDIATSDLGGALSVPDPAGKKGGLPGAATPRTLRGYGEKSGSK